MIVASKVPGDDGFAIKNDAAAYIGDNLVNTVFKVSPSGVVNIVAGGMTGTVVAGASSRPLGRTRGNRAVFCVSTNGIPPMVLNATSQGG